MEFSTNGNGDLNKSNLNMNLSLLNNSMTNIFDNNEDNNNISCKEEDGKELKFLEIFDDYKNDIGNQRNIKKYLFHYLIMIG